MSAVPQMSTLAESPLAFARSARRRSRPRIDFVMVALLAALLLFGLVMVTSASISVASHEAAANSFSYLERQLVFVAA